VPDIEGDEEVVNPWDILGECQCMLTSNCLNLSNNVSFYNH
jgi:hypothetical protein